MVDRRRVSDPVIHTPNTYTLPESDTMSVDEAMSHDYFWAPECIVEMPDGSFLKSHVNAFSVPKEQDGF